VKRTIVLAMTVVAGLLASMFPASAETIVDRPFEDESWTEGLVDLRSLDFSRTNLVGNAFAGGGLGVRIPTGGFRGFGPLDRLGPFDDPSGAPEEVWFRYHVRLVNWNAASTGKLPGLAGLYGSSGRGCIPSTETNRGWSARQMFGAPGTNGAPTGRIPIGTYLYHVDQAGDCGDALWWGAGLEQGRWHCVEGHVRMNTPGQNNGVIRGWLDGDLKLARSNIQYRRAGESGVKVRHLWHNVYFGGSWPTPNPLSLQYDEVTASTSGRVGCLQPFTDIGETIHSKAIVDLHATGNLFGCAYRKACPSQTLTRGQAAAMISRILNLPPASRDYFSDDNGTTFEGVINRLAEARIARGCDPPANTSYCPDATVTRAEIVTMLGRALGLRGDAPKVFSDVNGHWAEADINRFAAAGLTSGCGSDRFCPNRTLPRDEAFAFFSRSLSLLKPMSLASVDTAADWPPPGDPPPIPEDEQD
jgi:hypothetical protein